MSIKNVSVVALVAGMLITAGCFCTPCGKKGSCGGGPCGKATECKPAAGVPAEISTAGLKALLDSKAPLALLDARTGKYDDGKRIPGAASLSPEATAEQVEKVIKGKDSLVVTYCASVQCPASLKLAAHLKELGYKNILEYKPGIAGWIADGNGVENAVK